MKEDICLSRVYTPDGPGEEKERRLIREHALSLYVSGALYASFSCLRDRLPELVCGQLLSDGRIRSAAELSACRFSADERRCDVTLAAVEPAGEKPGPAPAVWEPDWIFAAAERFARGTALYRETAAVHAAYLNRGGETLFVAEDISRHCAVVKALGHMLLREYAPESCWLFVSCRVNGDMVRRTAAAGIRLLASKSVPTADAADSAGALGTTLLCRAWPDRFERYA